MKTTILLLMMMASTSAGASKSDVLIKPSDLIGTWRCGPVVMHGSAFTVTASGETTWEKGGKYVSLGTAVLEAPGRTPVTIKDKSTGTWRLESGIIKTQVLRAEFLSASDPNVTREAGQRAVDEQQKKKSIYHNRVLEYTKERYRTFPVNAMHKEAEVELSCERT